MSNSPRFPKPTKRSWRTAWRTHPLRDDKDLSPLLAVMALCWILFLGGIVLWAVLD